MVFFRYEAPQNAAVVPWWPAMPQRTNETAAREQRAQRDFTSTPPPRLSTPHGCDEHGASANLAAEPFVLLPLHAPPAAPQPRPCRCAWVRTARTTTAYATAFRSRAARQSAASRRCRGHHWARRHHRPPLPPRPAHPGARGGRRRAPCTSRLLVDGAATRRRRTARRRRRHRARRPPTARRRELDRRRAARRSRRQPRAVVAVQPRRRLAEQRRAGGRGLNARCLAPLAAAGRSSSRREQRPIANFDVDGTRWWPRIVLNTKAYLGSLQYITMDS